MTIPLPQVLQNLANALLGNCSLFECHIKGVPGLTRVVRFDGHESISGLFEFHIELAGDEVDLGTVVGRPATLKIHGMESPRYVHGIVSHIESGGYSRSCRLYSLTLVPPLWRLLHRRDCRIFQPATTPQILADVLRGAGMNPKEFRFELKATYEPRDYCVQYRESDFNFVSRLMEEDGIFYYYEHGAKEATLVIADDPGVHVPIAGLPLLTYDETSAVRNREHVTQMAISETIRPGKVSLRDFNFHRPGESMEVDAHAGADVDLEIYDYPGEYQMPTEGGPEAGRSMAKIRLEALQASRRRGSGRSDCVRMHPGHIFALAGHPNDTHNGRFLLTQVVHQGSQPQVLDQDSQGAAHYGNTFTVMPAEVAFRPPRVTPRPHVRGVQSATVVGAGTEEVHTDEQGRVMVQFHWDRLGKMNEQSSCWVRVSQAWAGNGWGSMFIPRVGHEVLVDFIEGDPDRPIITGRVYHGGNEVPYPLPEQKTKSTMKSNSSPGGGGFNEVRFEDRKYAEQLFIHAQRNKDVCVRNDSMESVLHDRHLTVGAMLEAGKVGDFNELTHRDRSITVHRDHHEHVGGDLRLRIGGIDGGGHSDVVIEGVKREHVKQSSHLHVDDDRREEVGGTHFLRVGDLHILVDGAIHLKCPTIVVEATETLSLQGGGSFIHLDEAGIALEGPMVWLNSSKSTIPGAMNEDTSVELARRAQPVQPRPADGGLVTYEAGFVLEDEDGQPLPFTEYIIRTESGREYPGTTDEHGHTEMVHSFKEEDVEVEILGNGCCRT